MPQHVSGGLWCEHGQDTAFISRHLDVAWNDPRSPGTVLGNAGIRLMTDVAVPSQGSSAADRFGWGFQAASPPAQPAHSAGWGTLGMRSVPRTLRCTTVATPLPRMAALRRHPPGLRFDGAKGSVQGLVMIPYEALTVDGSGASTCNGERFGYPEALQWQWPHHDSDTPSAVTGDPGLISEVFPWRDALEGTREAVTFRLNGQLLTQEGGEPGRGWRF